MQLRWAIPITLWTMLSGPVLARPRPPVQDHAKHLAMKSDSSGQRAKGPK
jgi:hypothetical protein